MSTILIHNAHVITMDERSGSRPIVASLRVADGVIVAIGSDLEPQAD